MKAMLPDTITKAFIASADRDAFNGSTASTLVSIGESEAALRQILSDLVQQGDITAVFSSQVVNMHLPPRQAKSTRPRLRCALERPHHPHRFLLAPSLSAVPHELAKQHCGPASRNQQGETKMTTIQTIPLKKLALSTANVRQGVLRTSPIIYDRAEHFRRSGRHFLMTSSFGDLFECHYHIG